jgi:hypothetical protein
MSLDNSLDRAYYQNIKHHDKMTTIAEVRELLHKIQRTYAHQRAETIGQLQEKIWDESNEFDEEVQQALDDLASDLNFYETDPRDRDEALGYYGDDKLNEIITSALAAIDK